MKFANIVVGILTISANQKEKSEPSSKTEAQTLIWRISYLRLATYNLDSDELMTDAERTYKRLTKDAGNRRRFSQPEREIRLFRPQMGLYWRVSHLHASHHL